MFLQIDFAKSINRSSSAKIASAKSTDAILADAKTVMTDLITLSFQNTCETMVFILLFRVFTDCCLGRRKEKQGS